jgi:glycosyltransferase involved in cell wall biosynthesis
MRVLLVHDRYKIRGGEDECHAAELDMLRAAGIPVESYEDDNGRIDRLGQLRTAIETVWSQASYRAIRARLRADRHDVVHVHNFFPLVSPAVYHAAKAEGAAVVQTLHNYRLACPSGIFFRDGRVCEDCLGKPIAWPSVVHGCYRGSRTGTAAVATMLGVHRLIGTWRHAVDVYVALNAFMRDKAIASGLPASKIVVKPNFVARDPGRGDGGGGFALFTGRLNPEKGILEVLAAWRLLGARMPLKIIGDGPLEGEVRAAAAAIPGIEYLGRQPLDVFYRLLGQARLFVLASTWYEGFPRVVIEAYASGTPIVAPALGPIAEVVVEGRTGIHFRPGDVEDLVAKVEWLLGHAEAEAALRAGARREFETRYTAAANRSSLLSIYRRALEASGGRAPEGIVAPVS